MASASSVWPLIGRDAELQLIRDALGRGTAKGVVVYGPAGVGKTRLMQVVCEEWERAHGVVLRVVATRDGAAFPLAALAPLLATRLTEGSEMPQDPVRLLAHLQAVIRVGGGPSRPLLFVDDVPLLDPLSAVLITQLVEGGGVLLLGTVRTGDPLPDVYHGRWSADGMTKIDLPPLTESDCARLLGRVLSAPVASRSVSRLHAASGGIPLHLRELVASAQADETLALIEGVWQLTGGAIRNPALAHALQTRIDRLEPAATAVLRRVAICQPLELDDLADEVTDRLVDLENAGLIEVDQEPGGDWAVRLTHPAYADLIRAGVSRLQRRTILLDQIALVRARDRGLKDVVRVCMWELEATGRADPAVLVAAARLAREGHEFELVRDLSRAAVDSAPDPPGEALLLLGEALRELGDGGTARGVLGRAASTPSPPDIQARIAVTRAGLECHGLNRPDRAAEILAEARRSVPEQAATMALARSIMLTVAEDIDAALTEFHTVEPHLGRSPELAGLCLLAGTGALVAAGRPAEALGLADELLPKLRGGGSLMHDGMPSMLRASALLDLHGPDRALPDATAALRQCLDSGLDRLVCYAESQLYAVRLAAGHVRSAARWAREVISVGRKSQQRSFVAMSMCHLATALAMAGEPGRAEQLLDALAADKREFPPPPGWAPSWEVRAAAWTSAAHGALSRASQQLGEGARSAAGRGQWQAAATLWHDSVRIGDNRIALDGLREAAARCTSPLVDRQFRHAVAAAKGDVDELSAVAADWASSGWRLVAAETYLAAADAARQTGAGRRVAALAARAAEISAGCQGASTPGLWIGGAIDPLSPREREVAALASRGLRSREIAESLVVSIRTVDNHLQSVYGKLGITGRRELADALRPT